MTVLLPFTPVDELGCHVDSAAEPNGIHLEVRVDGHLDAARLRAAVLASLAAHPLARALRVRWRGWHRRFTWAIADAPAVAPLDEVRWRTEDDLAGHRASLLAAAPPLDLGPPLRFRHAVGPDQDVLFLNVHHAAMDGMSCLRLLRSVARRYAGLPDPPVADPLAVRAVAGRTVTAQHTRYPRQATRIAVDTAAPGPGSGFHLTSLPLGVRDGLTKSATVNDVLIAALVLAVETWNREHGHDAGAVRITMPVNARATPGAEEPLGNLSRLTVVTGMPPAEGRSPDGLLADITGQTAATKLGGGPQIDAVSRLFATPWLPVAVKARLLALARRLIPVGDTAMLSNLGRIGGPLDFGPGAPAVGVWFSPPVRLPAGLAVGVVTLDGRLNLCFRYRHALLDPRTAARFAETFRTALDSLDDPRLATLRPSGADCSPGTESWKGIHTMIDDPDAHARGLAAASDSPTGWFEQLYSQAERGDAIVPWDRGTPHALLADWARDRDGTGQRALVIGCGLGRDSEYLASLRYDTVAFDVSPTAVESTRNRFPETVVDYRVADLLDPPAEWHHAFDLVVESLTVQALPPDLHDAAIESVTSLVAPGGTLLVISAAGDGDPAAQGPPWPLTRAEIESFATGGLTIHAIDNDESRWRAEFRRS